LVVIGVTDEAEGLAKPYLATNKVGYRIAYGDKAPGYPTNGIPAAWLVAPDGKIVWQGHPASLDRGLIERLLKDAKVPPSFDFEGDLAKASSLVNAGNYTKAISEFEKVADKSEDAAEAERARAAIAQILEYGEWSLAKAKASGEQGDYSRAMLKLKKLAAAYKSTPVGEKADDQFKEWRKDPKVKAELEGAEIVELAKELMAKGKYKDAARALAKVVKGKKFEESSIRDDAQKLFDEAMSKL
jgi:tetratricopeptide (TPR) repeat protein